MLSITLLKYLAVTSNIASSNPKHVLPLNKLPFRISYFLLTKDLGVILLGLHNNVQSIKNSPFSRLPLPSDSTCLHLRHNCQDLGRQSCNSSLHGPLICAFPYASHPSHCCKNYFSKTKEVNRVRKRGVFFNLHFIRVKDRKYCTDYRRKDRWF